MFFSQCPPVLAKVQLWFFKSIQIPWYFRTSSYLFTVFSTTALELVHKFTFLKCFHSTLFGDRWFPEGKKQSQLMVVRNICGWRWKQRQNENKECLLQPAPTNSPLSLCWLQRAFSDGVASRQGTSLKTTKSVYVDIIFFWKLPEEEPCEASFKKTMGKLGW